MLLYSNFVPPTTITQRKRPLFYFSIQEIGLHFAPGSRRIKFSRKIVTTQISAMQQKITVLNRHGEKLVGVLHETGSPELVVLCHGFKSSKEYNMMVNLATALENEGISAFRFDFSGNGESEGTFQFGNYSTEAEDLRSVVEYFTRLNRSTVAVVGHSKGAGVVLLYASKYHDIPAVVSISGRYDLKRGLEERLGKDFMDRLKKDGCIDIKTNSGEVDYRVTLDSMMERLDTNMHEAGLAIDNKCRVLIVHGSADEIIPVEDGIEFGKIIPNKRLLIIQGANHGFTSHQHELVAAVLPFVKECMQLLKDSPNE